MATRNDRSRIEVQPISTRRGKDEIEKGKVGEAKQKFQGHVDTALAYQIQSTEVESHFSRNKQKRKTVQNDVKTAKETYLEEVRNARILPDDSLAEIEQKQWLAEELRRRIEEQEHFAKVEQERQRQKDEELALQMQRDEEKKKRYLEQKRLQRMAKDEEEYRRLQRIMKELEEADLNDPGEPRYDDVIRLPENNDIIVLADGIAIDARQNEIQTEEQQRQNMERKDEELAKILQQQEDHQIEKRRSMHEDYRKAIELQDREIAKLLQRQEKAKAERVREKLMRRIQSLPERDEVQSGERRHVSRHRNHVDDLRREDVPPVVNANLRMDYRGQGDTVQDERFHVDPVRSDGYEEVWNARSGGTRALTSGMLATDNGQEPGNHFDNIAEVLDPTYTRASRRASELDAGEDSERYAGGKSASFVPPMKRKMFKEKGKSKP